MDKEELLRRAKDPKYIPGIYNYCDRWCERCAFTSRCLNHTFDAEQDDRPEDSDEANEAFWNQMMQSFDLALSLLKDLAEKENIDLDSIDLEEAHEKDRKVHILSHLARKYADMVDQWLDGNQDLIESVFRKQQAHPHLKLIQPQTEEAALPLKEVVEVITYYKFPIGAKITRALESKDHEKRLDLGDMPKDSDGSAKIALIEIDRSISAWSALLAHLPDQSGEILKLVNYLERIREIAEKEFPDARAFVRPGFDEKDQG